MDVFAGRKMMHGTRGVAENIATTLRTQASARSSLVALHDRRSLREPLEWRSCEARDRRLTHRRQTTDRRQQMKTTVAVLALVLAAAMV